jgi:hypothetical protein
VVLGTLAGCGSSVADRDGPAPVRATAAPPSPFCAALEESLAATAPLTNRSGVPAEELDNAVGAARRANVELVDNAPANLRADVERYVAALELQLDALLANGGDTLALAGDEAWRPRSPPRDGRGRQRVQAYVEDTCTPTAP